MSPNARTFYIPPDETGTLISIAFLDSVDYDEALAFVQAFVEKARDANHEVHVAGQPTLYACGNTSCISGEDILS